jgi:hypothetical protein
MPRADVSTSGQLARHSAAADGAPAAIPDKSGLDNACGGAGAVTDLRLVQGRQRETDDIEGSFSILTDRSFDWAV